MIDQILETYCWIISHLEQLPNTKIGDIFEDGLPGLRKEYGWLMHLKASFKIHPSMAPSEVTSMIKALEEQIRDS